MRDTCVNAADWLASDEDEPTAPLARTFAGGVGLCAYPYPGGYNYYSIEWSRLNTPSKVPNWIRHLSGKRWFSADMCRNFIDAVSKHFGWRQGGGL